MTFAHVYNKVQSEDNAWAL